ncbi:MAG: transposase [Bacteroidales bacterium]|nr:transposase [Bacteroidales bacterium]
MKDIFSQLKQVEFESIFSEDEKCLEFLATEKWKDGYVCRKCGHTNYCQGKTPFSRRCTRCKTDESATAHTIFHRCKIPLHEAFKIAYLVCGQPEISSYDLSRTIEIRQMTCWKFKKKISECVAKQGFLNMVENQ